MRKTMLSDRCAALMACPFKQPKCDRHDGETARMVRASDAGEDCFLQAASVTQLPIGSIPFFNATRLLASQKHGKPLTLETQ